MLTLRHKPERKTGDRRQERQETAGTAGTEAGAEARVGAAGAAAYTNPSQATSYRATFKLSKKLSA